MSLLKKVVLCLLDFDNDGDLDLWTGRGGFEQQEGPSYQSNVYVNDKGKFSPLIQRLIPCNQIPVPRPFGLPILMAMAIWICLLAGELFLAVIRYHREVIF
jgi:hypothetical protein